MAMSESKMAEFKMAGIIKLSQDEQVNFFLYKMAVSKIAEFKMAAIINLSENEQVKFFLCKWLNPWWQNTRWLPSSSLVRMNQFESDWIRLSQSFVQNGWIQDGRIQDGCHHLFSQIELVWVRVRVEEDCFEWIWEKITRCLNPKWQCLNPTWQSLGWLPSSSWVRINEWSFFVQIEETNLGKCEWVWEEKLTWLNPRWPNSRWLPSSS